MRHRTLQVLEGLQEYLSESTLIIQGDQNNEVWSLDNGSDSSVYSDEGDDQGGNLQMSPPSLARNKLEDQVRAIVAANASLMKLSMIIRSPATRDDYVKAASRFDTWNPFADIGHVKEKYGSAKHSTDWLLERLGKAITRRRQFLRYRNEHNEKLLGHSQDDEAIQHSKPEKTIFVSTKATTFVGENVVQNIRAPASDGGNSFASQTSYEATVFGTNVAPRMLTVPSPPKFAFPNIPFKYGEAFQCPYCFTEQVVKGKSAWKKHVFRDLKPYVCTFESCDLLMFRSRNEWFEHELQNHRREWICQFCEHSAFPTTSAFSKHMNSNHQGVLTDTPLEAQLLQSEEPVDKIDSSACGLCDSWEETLREQQASIDSLQSSPDDKNVRLYGKLKPFRRHLGRHMEQLALFALSSNLTEELDEENTIPQDEAFSKRLQEIEHGPENSSDEEIDDDTERLIEMSKQEMNSHSQQSFSLGSHRNSGIYAGTTEHDSLPKEIKIGTYNIMRRIVGESWSNEELEVALKLSGSDLNATLNSLIEGLHNDQSVKASATRVPHPSLHQVGDETREDSSDQTKTPISTNKNGMEYVWSSAERVHHRPVPFNNEELTGPLSGSDLARAISTNPAHAVPNLKGKSREHEETFNT
ncbi:hypothetical protein BJ875DRAFT_106323 [Amylocarpus encephaloides]|uniref:C2H2-type domain-containing protein n=1 Tax=Amylocarpus encephaloides TaxID=45428 RepID=A0A9P7YEL4_9HELO|nr:hypothetical protein BJ875DRAFT_106323 [Amylocarpus encephaloides]